MQKPIGFLAALAAMASTMFCAHAGDVEEQALFALILSKDTAMFEAFNSCKGEAVKEYIDEDVEFFHDLDGLSIGSAIIEEAVNTSICGNFTRQLLQHTMEVWPIPGYGAVQTGKHTFTNVGADRPHGIARFMHIWQQEGDTWRITRVVSYDHDPYTPEGK